MQAACTALQGWQAERPGFATLHTAAQAVSTNTVGVEPTPADCPVWSVACHLSRLFLVCQKNCVLACDCLLMQLCARLLARLNMTDSQ